MLKDYTRKHEKVNSIYEMPSNAEIVVDTTYMGVEETADYVMSKLDEYLSLKY